MVNVHKLGYSGGMAKDFAKAKTNPETYLNAKNIRVSATDQSSLFALTNEKGNELELTIPTPSINYTTTEIRYAVGLTIKSLPYTAIGSGLNRCEIESEYIDMWETEGSSVWTPRTSGDQVIIGVCDTRNGAIVATTDNNGFDCFWEVSNIDVDKIEIDLLYMNNLNLSKNNLLQIIYNFENSIIQKIYFADGVNQLRFMNIRQSIENGDLVNLADLKAKSINTVSEYELSSPKIKNTAPGGSHTAGKIQYAYNLYVLNGSQTAISPLSEVQTLDNGPGGGGGGVNENVSRTVSVSIENLDADFTHVRLYSIKYTSYNVAPEVGLIADREIGNHDEFNYFDSGVVIEPISLAEFLFLGSNPITPKHIESKDNRLFAFNYKERSFDVDLDTRAYGHSITGQAKVWEDIVFEDGNLSGSETTLNTTTYDLPEKHDAVNRSYITYPYTNTDSQGTLEKQVITIGIARSSEMTQDTSWPIQINGVDYFVPLLLGDEDVVIKNKIHNYLEANITGYDITSGSLGFGPNRKWYVKATAQVAELKPEPVTFSPIYGATFTYAFTLGADLAPGFGAEGKYFRLTINQKEFEDEEAITHRYLKDNEIYRFGIVFFNNVGQSTSPKWICDLKAPVGNLEGKYNTVQFDTKPDFQTWLNTTEFEEGQKPIGYKLLRAERTLLDKTIVTQGMLNGMVANFRSDNKNGGNSQRFNEAASKMPSLTRQFGLADHAVDTEHKNLIQPYTCGMELSNVKFANESGAASWSGGYRTETHTAGTTDDFVAQNWQYNRLMQMYTPEVLFENVEIDSSYKLRVLGLQKLEESGAWNSEFHVTEKVNKSEAKYTNGWAVDQRFYGYDPATGTWGVSPVANPTITESMLGEPGHMSDHGIWGPTEASDCTGYSQLYKRHKTFFPSTGLKEYGTFGTPEITERGAGFKAYMGEAKLRYSNSLETLLQDNWENADEVNVPQQIRGVNSWGAKCITFAESTAPLGTPTSWRKSIEQIYQLAAPSGGGGFGILVGEFYKPDQFLYAGNAYGGNSFESKSGSTYIEVGSYSDISITSSQIDSPGDTYVQEFIFTKLSKTDTEISDRSLSQCTEFCSFMVETNIDLKNRNDLSIGPWDNRYQPRYNEWQEYNRVYSQEANLVKNAGLAYNFKKVKEFDGRIISTKLKTPGENIDSFTDFLENETMDLDGKYGPINATLNFNDNIIAFQDNAVAMININPRVQIAPGDGASIELGTGGILHDYRYLTTESGCLNKRGVIATPTAFYYLDLNTLSLMQSNGSAVLDLADQKGFHSFFSKNLSYESLARDNAVIGQGPSFSYNPVNNEVYFTMKQLKNSVGGFGVDLSRNDYTLCLNENLGRFTSFYDYTPAWYINKGNQMLTSDPTSKQLWSHFKGNNGSFYGTVHDSSITWNVVPQGKFGEYTFNNLNYKMEAKDVYGNDVKGASFNKVQLANEYQDSGVRDLVLGKNLKRRNRTWSVILPREQDSMNRIKSPWVLLTMTIDNNNNLSMVAHDLIVSYNEY